MLLKISFLATSRDAQSPSKPPRLCQDCAGLSLQLFKPPIMPDSVGQKAKEPFLQSCGHTGIIHSSVLDICESYKQKGGH